MEVRAYWSLVLHKVAAATISHWRNKMLLGLVLGMLALAIQYGLHIRTISDTQKLAISLVGSAVIVLLASFIWNLLTIPAAIYPEPKTRTAGEEYHFQRAQRFLLSHGTEFADILRLIKTSGRLVLGKGQSGLPPGIDVSRALAILKELQHESIVKGEECPPPSLPSDPAHRMFIQMTQTKIVWAIAPGFETVLDELLYLPATQSGPE
jgi:hypothetical protein